MFEMILTLPEEELDESPVLSKMSPDLDVAKASPVEIRMLTWDCRLMLSALDTELVACEVTSIEPADKAAEPPRAPDPADSLISPAKPDTESKVLNITEPDREDITIASEFIINTSPRLTLLSPCIRDNDNEEVEFKLTSPPFIFTLPSLESEAIKTDPLGCSLNPAPAIISTFPPLPSVPIPPDKIIDPAFAVSLVTNMIPPEINRESEVRIRSMPLFASE
jgi:hypothetical protein